MKFQSISQLKKGFTLIELLIVIAILALLAGVSIPTILSAMDTAKETATKQKCNDIIQGIRSYQNDYNGNLPFLTDDLEVDDNNQFVFNTANGVDAGILAVLTNREKGRGERLNPDGSVYLRSDLADGPRDGLYLNNSGELGLFDPWGKPYYITISDESEGCIDPFTGKPTFKPIIVYSLGSDKEGIAPGSSPEANKSSDKPRRSNAKGRAQAKAAAAAASEELEEVIADNVYSWKNVSN